MRAISKILLLPIFILLVACNKDSENTSFIRAKITNSEWRGKVDKIRSDSVAYYVFQFYGKSKCRVAEADKGGFIFNTLLEDGNYKIDGSDVLIYKDSILEYIMYYQKDRDIFYCGYFGVNLFKQ